MNKQQMTMQSHRIETEKNNLQTAENGGQNSCRRSNSSGHFKSTNDQEAFEIATSVVSSVYLQLMVLLRKERDMQHPLSVPHGTGVMQTSLPDEVDTSGTFELLSIPLARRTEMLAEMGTEGTAEEFSSLLDNVWAQGLWMCLLPTKEISALSSSSSSSLPKSISRDLSNMDTISTSGSDKNDDNGGLEYWAVPGVSTVSQDSSSSRSGSICSGGGSSLDAPATSSSTSSSSPSTSSSAVNEPLTIDESSLFAALGRLGSDQGAAFAANDVASKMRAIRVLSEAVERLVLDQPSVVDIPAPTKIFGDLHGQLKDVLSLMLQHASFPYSGEGSNDEDIGITNNDIDMGISYIFNGNFVDHGPHQLETALLLLSLKIVNPDNVYLIRGNYECRWTIPLYFSFSSHRLSPVFLLFISHSLIYLIITAI